jgi:hypothetical protein
LQRIIDTTPSTAAAVQRSDRSLKAITDMIDSARSVEGLPEQAGGGTAA